MANTKIGPYLGQGSVGKKTNDAEIKNMAQLKNGNSEQTVVYNEHQKAVATKDSNILKRNKVPEYRQQ